MTNAIKALLQMTSVSLQPVPSLHQKFPDGIVVCTDDNYSCQYDIKQIYFIATNIFLICVILNVPMARFGG
jgi:hypothetical protein